MNGLNRDTGVFKKVLLGALAAGSGVAVYYGFTRWKSRRDLPKKPDQGKEEVKDDSVSAEETSKADKVQSPPPSADPEPPIQTSTPGISRASSTEPNHDLLSLSGSFEKVSLSALRENHDADDSFTGQSSPSESFEKVNLPPKIPVSKDAPLVDVISPPGSRVTEIVFPAGGNSNPTAEPTKSVPASTPRVQFEEKIIKADSSSVQFIPPTREKTNVSIDLASVLAPASHSKKAPELPPPLLPKILPPSQIPKPSKQVPIEAKSIARVPEAIETSQKPKPEESCVSQEKEDEVAEQDSSEEEEEEEGEDGSASDASADSQAEMTRV